MAVRTRVLAAVLGVAAIGMLVAGVTSFLVQRERVDARIDDNLAQEVEELREFADNGVDPETGGEFTTVDRFLEVVLTRNVPDRDEGLLGLVDGVVTWFPGSAVHDTDLPGRIPVTGTDDISELARTFNDMLDRLEIAFAGQRDALDDAGHELRTPITIIRGHLELMDSAHPADVEEVRALVLDKARALADRNWRVDARVSATVLLDPQRITQALLQLISNAVKFTAPGDVIAVGSQLTGDEVRLWVRDTGAGIAADDLERIFDRFARADVGRGVDGSGLGLAIVRAIAEAHRGTVTVDSSPGDGAIFTIALPPAGIAAADDLVEEEA